MAPDSTPLPVLELPSAPSAQALASACSLEPGVSASSRGGTSTTEATPAATLRAQQALETLPQALREDVSELGRLLCGAEFDPVTLLDGSRDLQAHPALSGLAGHLRHLIEQQRAARSAIDSVQLQLLARCDRLRELQQANEDLRRELDAFRR